MSKVAEFYAKVIADEKLRNEAVALLGDKTPQDFTEEELANLSEFSGRNGYELTVAEIREYLAAEVKDLSDEAMDAVAGGHKYKGDYSCTGNNSGNIVHKDGSLTKR